MEVVLICFPLVTSMLPCTLAFLWKQRNGLPWFLLSVVSTYPIAVGYLRHVTEAIGGNPMGGTKAGILLASALLSAIAVSMVVAFIPKNRTHQKYRFPLKKKTVLQIIGITAVTLTILAVVLRAKMISYEQDLQLAMQYPQQAAEKALAEGNSSLLREAVNYWSHDDPAATLDWLESNIDDKQSGELRFGVLMSWILNDPDVELSRVESFLNSVSGEPFLVPLGDLYTRQLVASDPDGANNGGVE